MGEFTPIQDQSALWDDSMVESPCKKCNYRGSLPADECVERGDCPLNDNPHQVSSVKVTSHLVTYSPDPTEYCAFPECEDKSIAKKNLCSRHNKIVYNRRVTLGLDESRWFEPIGR